MNATRLNRVRAALLVVLASFPILAGSVCRTNPGGQACTLIAVASVVLNIRDAENKPVPNATVVFKRNYDAPVTVTCNGNCDSVVLAYELPGHFEYRVTAGGYVAATGTADVYMDEVGCHVVGKTATVVLQRDTTIGVLFGAWTYTNGAGQTTIIRFGEDGAPIGAILTNRVNTGDKNIYVRFNDKQIAGAPGQPIQFTSCQFPTRFTNIVQWGVIVVGVPIGFENATLATNFNSLTGTLLGGPVTYTRLAEIPAPLRDPS